MRLINRIRKRRSPIPSRHPIPAFPPSIPGAQGTWKAEHISCGLALNWLQGIISLLRLFLYCTHQQQPLRHLHHRRLRVVGYQRVILFSSFELINNHPYTLLAGDKTLIETNEWMYGRKYQMHFTAAMIYC